jgi:sugar lactone lactonase YvrE
MVRLAELNLYDASDMEAARYYFQRVNPERLTSEDATVMRALSRRLAWQRISASELGLFDDNISFLRVDGDDLWVGTWNGGVSRHSVASGENRAFPLPASMSRSMVIADRKVWVGTAEGLVWFSKLTSRWDSVDEFQTPDARNVQALTLVGNDLFAGTLGNGLFRLRDGIWNSVASAGLPGGYITSLAADKKGERLLIGTMTLGLLILDRKTGEIRSLSHECPSFTGTNVGVILPDSTGRIWIGTYGDGLFLWNGAAEVQRFTRAGGKIGDDWILSACETPKGIYFGSFGGGVSFLGRTDGSWHAIGIADGLASADVTSIARIGPYVFFGTLGQGLSRFFEGYAESGYGAKL